MLAWYQETHFPLKVMIFELKMVHKRTIVCYQVAFFVFLILSQLRAIDFSTSQIILFYKFYFYGSEYGKIGRFIRKMMRKAFN